MASFSLAGTLIGVLALPATLALAHEPQAGRGGGGPWPGEWLGHTGARIGVQVHSMTPELREYFGAERDRGVLVAQVAPGSPAADAGLLPGDVIVAAGGEPIRAPHELIRSVQRHSGEGADGRLELRVVREHSERTVAVTPRPGTGSRALLRDSLTELRSQLEELQRRMREMERRLGPASPDKVPD